MKTIYVDETLKSNLLPLDYKVIITQTKKEKNIDMENCIQIGNINSNFDTNAKIKILYKNDNDCIFKNVLEDVIIINNWEDINSILNFYERYNYDTLEERI